MQTYFWIKCDSSTIHKSLITNLSLLWLNCHGFSELTLDISNQKSKKNDLIKNYLKFKQWGHCNCSLIVMLGISYIWSAVLKSKLHSLAFIKVCNTLPCNDHNVWVKLTKPSQGFDIEGHLIYFPKSVSSGIKTDRCCRRWLCDWSPEAVLSQPSPYPPAHWPCPPAAYDFHHSSSQDLKNRNLADCKWEHKKLSWNQLCDGSFLMLMQ